MRNSTPEKQNNYSSLFRFHGVDLVGKGNKLSANCILCGKERHFFVNTSTGQWDCKRCSKSGNAYGFLHDLWETAHDSTSAAEYRKLEKDRRGLPARFLKEHGYASWGDRWLIPVFNTEKKIVNLHVKEPGQPVISSPGCSLHLFGEELLPSADGKPLFICEGPWDRTALQYLLTKGKKPGVVVGVPGAGVFKKEWLKLLPDTPSITLLYDNDTAGFNGMKRAMSVLQADSRFRSKVSAINWPSKTPDGYDLNDFVSDRLQRLPSAWKELQKLFSGGKKKTSTSQPNSTTNGDMVCLANVKAKPMHWMWENRIPAGTLTIVSGNPGTGKGFLTIDIASRITRGDYQPDSRKRFRKGSVIMIGAEDALADVVKPRLMAARANCRKVFDLKIDGLKSGLDVLESKICSLRDCRLVVIDPVSCFLEDTKSNCNSDVRALLRPLAELAERTGVAIVMVDHLNKDSGKPAAHRSQGSIAFTAAPRASWFVIEDPQNPDRRLWLPNKITAARRRPSGLAYRIKSKTIRKIGQIGHIVWDKGAVTLRPDDVMGMMTPQKTVRTEAEQWLRERLSSGKKRWVQTLKKMAAKNDVGWKQVYKASLRLRVEKSKPGGKGSKSYWSLPNARKTGGITKKWKSGKVEK